MQLNYEKTTKARISRNVTRVYSLVNPKARWTLSFDSDCIKLVASGSMIRKNEEELDDHPYPLLFSSLSIFRVKRETNLRSYRTPARRDFPAASVGGSCWSPATGDRKEKRLVLKKRRCVAWRVFVDLKYIPAPSPRRRFAVVDVLRTPKNSRTSYSSTRYFRVYRARKKEWKEKRDMYLAAGKW